MQTTIRATVTGVDLPRHLPGYLTVTMTDARGDVFVTDVIETDESETYFTAGAEVDVVVLREDDGSESIHTPWTRYGKIVRNRTRRAASG